VIAAALAGEPSGLRGRAGLADVADVALPALALAAICYPFAIALLFGNLDAWFPLAYGAVLLATSGRSGRWVWPGGVLLGIATIAKLHPGALLAWLAFRGAREWGARRHGHQPSAPVEGVATGEPRQTAEAHSGAPAAWATLAIALGAMGLITGASLVIGGLGPWADYLALLRSGSGAAFASGLNIGPASQIALVMGDPALAPRLAAVVAGLALGLVVLAAVAIRSTPASFAVAAVASLTISPITWFHYPVAVMPVAVAAWVLARGTPGAVRTAWLLVGAVVIAALSISAPVAVWVAVAMVVLAVALVSADDGRPRAGTTYTDRP